MVLTSSFSPRGWVESGLFQPESFRPGLYRLILGVGCFGLGRWVVLANILGESIWP